MLYEFTNLNYCAHTLKKSFIYKKYFCFKFAFMFVYSYESKLLSLPPYYSVYPISHYNLVLCRTQKLHCHYDRPTVKTRLKYVHTTTCQHFQFLTPERAESTFVTGGKRPFCTRSTLEILLAAAVDFWEKCLCCLVELWRRNQKAQWEKQQKIKLSFVIIWSVVNISHSI